MDNDIDKDIHKDVMMEDLLIKEVMVVVEVDKEKVQDMEGVNYSHSQKDVLRMFQAVSRSTISHTASLPTFLQAFLSSLSSLMSLFPLFCKSAWRRLLLLPGGNMRLKLLPTFWFKLVTRLLLLPKFRFTWSNMSYSTVTNRAIL